MPRSTNENLQKVSANDSDDPEEFCTDFKTKVLKVSKSCVRDSPRMSESVFTKETMNIIQESRRARHEGKTGKYRELKREAVRALRRDKEAQGPWSLRDSGEPLVVN